MKEAIAGPSYVFEVKVFNPALTAVRQHQISQAGAQGCWGRIRQEEFSRSFFLLFVSVSLSLFEANFWQLRLVRRSAGRDSTAAGRAATGYQLLPVLQDRCLNVTECDV